MKSSVSKLPPPPPAFTPVTLTLTFETQDELDAVSTLFNHSNLCTFLSQSAGMRDRGENIRHQLKAAGADCSRFIRDLNRAIA